MSRARAGDDDFRHFHATAARRARAEHARHARRRHYAVAEDAFDGHYYIARRDRE